MSVDFLVDIDPVAGPPFVKWAEAASRDRSPSPHRQPLL